MELPPHRPRQHGFIELIMVRLHPDTPDDLEIPILMLCSVLDQVVDEVPSRSILGAVGWPHTYNSSSASVRVIEKILSIGQPLGPRSSRW